MDLVNGARILPKSAAAAASEREIVVLVGDLTEKVASGSRQVSDAANTMDDSLAQADSVNLQSKRPTNAVAVLWLENSVA